MEHTILFGNGFNNLSKHPISWNHLLNSIKQNQNFENGTLPNTLIYERALFQNHISDDIRETESLLKKTIADQLRQIESNEYHHKLINLKFKNYLTTNYDYALENKYLDEIKGTSLVNKSTEDIYSVRRSSQVLNSKGQEISRIWHIHGEINHPMSIMLGFDQYCGSVGKIDGYIKGTYEFQENKKLKRIDRIERKLELNRFDKRSWTELFFNSNVHVVGLGLDFSETDLWWLINKRARMMLDKKTRHLLKNKIYFYTSDDITQQKEGTLKSFNVEVIKTDRNDNWSGYYQKTIEKIKRKIS